MQSLPRKRKPRTAAQQERHKANLRDRTERGICRQCRNPRHLHYTLCIDCRDKVQGYKNPNPRDLVRARAWQRQHTQKKGIIPFTP